MRLFLGFQVRPREIEVFVDGLGYDCAFLRTRNNIKAYDFGLGKLLLDFGVVELHELLDVPSVV